MVTSSARAGNTKTLLSLVALGALVACSNASPASDVGHLYELQSSCGSNARDWFRTLHGKDNLADFDSQYFSTIVKGFTAFT